MKKAYTRGTIRRLAKRDTTQPNSGTAATMTTSTITNSACSHSRPTVTAISSRTGRIT